LFHLRQSKLKARVVSHHVSNSCDAITPRHPHPISISV
jgi:hypothetical protein